MSEEQYLLESGEVMVVEQDDSPDNPRNWDNIGTMLCFHTRHILGDGKLGISPDDFDSYDDLKEWLIKEGAAVILPLYIYDHSGITMKTTPFGDRWDSGQVGFIYANNDKIMNEFADVTPEILAKVTEILEGEVETYDQYLTGDVYRYTVYKTETCSLGHTHRIQTDSCSGFYGDDPYTNGMQDHAGKIVKKL